MKGHADIESTEVGNRFAVRARAFAASAPRSFGGAGVTSVSSRWCVMWAICATASSNAARLLADGLVEPLTFRTNCRAAA